MSINFNPLAITDRLIETGIIDFSRQEGWSLNIHESYPQAPKAPFYTDLRRLTSFVSLFRDVVDIYVAMFRKSDIKLDRIADVPTASTPIATAMMMRTQIPLIRPRLDAKTHGQPNDIDGIWRQGQKVGIIDDIRTTGATKEKVIRILRNHDLEPVAIYVLIDYDPDAKPVAEVPVISVYTWAQLLKEYADNDLISQGTYQRSLHYHAELQAYIRERSRQIRHAV